MALIKVTGWSLHYITHEISLPALITLASRDGEEQPKAKGLLADSNLDVIKLKEMGFEVM